MTDKLKVLLIGGTGTISRSIMELLAKSPRTEVTVLNRGNHEVPENVHQIVADASDNEAMKQALVNTYWDCVADFIVYKPEQAMQRVELLQGKTKQYIFISTEVVFDHEGTVWLKEDSLQGNRLSLYGQQKAACEQIFKQAEDLPLTIVRPGQTYGYNRIPLSVKGNSCWSVAARILANRPVIVHGDGKSLWHSMHTYDFAYNFLQLIANPKAIGQSVNLINPQAYTWDMIYEELGRQLQKPVRLVHLPSDLLAMSRRYDFKASIAGDKQYSNLYNHAQLDELIPDFRCQVNMASGIKMYLNYMNQHPEEKKNDPAFDTWCDCVISDYRSFSNAFHTKY